MNYILVTKREKLKARYEKNFKKEGDDSSSDESLDGWDIRP